MIPLIAAQGLCKNYPSGSTVIHAVRDVSLSVSRGEVLLLQGPSGSGKTTLLQLLGLLTTPSAGSIVYMGSPADRLTSSERAAFRLAHCGFIFQDFCLLDSLSAIENVYIPTIPRPRTQRSHDIDVLDLLRKVGMEQRGDSRAETLSGGEKQRIAIARALTNRPELLLADEPTANLDTENAKEIMKLLRATADEGRGVIVSSHDVRMETYADTVLRLQDGRTIAT